MDSNEIGLMKLASGEIKRLRQANIYQSGRLQMFDDMMLLLRTSPGYGSSQGMQPDIASEIDTLVAKIEEESR